MANKVVFSFHALDRFTGVSRKVNRSVSRMTRGIKGLKRHLGDTDRVAKGATRRISSGFTRMAAAAATFFGAREFFTAGTRFQDSLADLSAITGATGKDLSFLSDEAMRLARVSGVAQDQVAGAFKVVASAKSELLKDPKALSQITEQVLLLKNATGMELAGAAQTALDAMNQFGASAQEANRFVNVLAAGSKIGASEVNQTGEAILRAGVAAKLTGVNFEEMNAMVQVLAKNGLKASEAGTGLQGVLLKLENTGKRRFQPSIVGVNQALKNLQEAQLSSKQMTKLFGLESIKAGGILINNADLVEQWTGKLKGTTVAQQQAGIRMNTFSFRMRKLGVLIKEFMIRAFLRLEPTLTKLAKKFGTWLSQLKPAQINSFVDGVVSLGEGLWVLIEAGRIVTQVFKEMGTAIGETLAQVSLGEFDKIIASMVKRSSFTTGWNIGKKLLGGESTKTRNGVSNDLVSEEMPPAAATSRTDVNVNMRAPEGVVESVKTTTRGNAPGMNVGVNMATAGG